MKTTFLTTPITTALLFLILGAAHVRADVCCESYCPEPHCERRVHRSSIGHQTIESSPLTLPAPHPKFLRLADGSAIWVGATDCGTLKSCDDCGTLENKTKFSSMEG